MTECLRVSDEGILAVAKYCRQLTELRLTKTSVTDFGVMNLVKRCPQIEFLDLQSCAITDIAISYIASRCHALRFLEISNTRVSSNGIEMLRTSNRLAGLRLHYITGTGLNMSGSTWRRTSFHDKQRIGSS